MEKGYLKSLQCPGYEIENSKIIIVIFIVTSILLFYLLDF